MSYIKSFLINDSELTYDENGALNNSAVFKDHDNNKYIRDPFNPLIKDDLIYHHKIRVYKDCYLNASKTHDIEKNVKDRFLYKKGILKDKLICIRPCESDFKLWCGGKTGGFDAEYRFIKFNLKVFCVNYGSDLIIERNALACDIIINEDISIENTLNTSVLFEVDELTIFQNTNICFIVLKSSGSTTMNSDLRALVVYDLSNNEPLETITDFKRLLFFDSDNKKFGILNKENRISVYKTKNNAIRGFYLKKMSSINDNFQLPLNKGFFQQQKTFLCVSDKTDGQIINFELPNLLEALPSEKKEMDLRENAKIQMDLFSAHKSPIYNVAISKSSKYVLSCSTSGTLLRLFIKTKNENKRVTCPQYHLYGEFKRGLEKALNYEIGFSNDERIAYCVSYKRTLHFYLIPEYEPEGKNKLQKSLIPSIQSLKLSTRITDDSCSIVILKSSHDKSDALTYNVYVIWRLSGIIELYDLTIGVKTKNSTQSSASYCKRINWLLLY